MEKWKWVSLFKDRASAVAAATTAAVTAAAVTAAEWYAVTTAVFHAK